MSPTSAPASISTAVGFHPKTMASPKIGLSPANREPAPIPWNRTPPPSGITTTLWGSTASTCTPASSAWRFYATTPKTHLASPRESTRSPIQIYDRQFTTDGQLYYPDSGDPEHPWVPEFGGSCTLLNGKIRPYLNVEPCLYRIRIVNVANSSFFSLSLTDRRPFHQIGSDQGLLAAPAKIANLQLAPAERADLLIDFSQAAGQRVQLINGVVGVLEFRVVQATSKPVSTARPSRRHEVLTAESIPSTLRAIDRIPESAAITTRTITLNEYDDRIGNSMLMLLNRKRWHEPVTETPRLNTTEIWDFVNLTEDTHPMHLHLVRFQVLDRRLFDVFAYRNNKGLRYLAPAIPPQPNEQGWKDTVQCLPGMITRIIVRFEGYPGKYLYHCHILEHEANDMMRPFEVIA